MSKQDLPPLAADGVQQITEQLAIPLLEEELAVSKRVVETGVLRLHKQTEERNETVEVPLTRVAWQVDHIPINQVVMEQPAIRQEGETTIYPVVEERVSVLRELVLVEEVRVTRTAVTTVETSSHVLRRERLLEERVPAVSEPS